jgi:mono/diheme cytochrome c family protein
VSGWDARSVLLALPLAAACSLRTPPPPGAPGDLIYELQNCANCHWPAGEGTARGPALDGLAAEWTPGRLAAFLAEPDGFREADARLRALERAYPGEMSRYDNLSAEQRLTLAHWLLAR